jgi:restriction endonuclease S subunit
MSFPRYPAYKPSGVEWLGEVPEHWEVKQLKHCIHRLGSGGTPESGKPEYWADTELDDSIPWVAIGDMSSVSIVRSTAKALSLAGLKEKNLEIFPAGSLLYSIYASLGKVSVLGINAAFNQAILAIIPNLDLVAQTFLKYWLESIERHLSYYSSSNTQANLNAAKVLAYPVAVPNKDEQARIATFLDHETAKIDALIAEQQRLIELLQEKRQAVISHAVTKGLNPVRR